MNFEPLLVGHDTIECSYFLSAGHNCNLDYEQLAFEKESLRQSKTRNPKLVTLGGAEFLLNPYGSSSGFPFMIENEDFIISFGEFNSPSFFVKFRSIALWQKGALGLHEQFMSWSKTLGLVPYREETLSRVDFCFDYGLPEVDFCEDDFVSKSKKDSRYRRDKKLQTLQFGKGDIVLRIYDKIAEIEEHSNKRWFYDLWGTDHGVWRIEWQIRKKILRRFGISTFDDLIDGQGDVLRYLATEHDTLRLQTNDLNRSRWPLHPLWINLQSQIDTLNSLGVYRDIDKDAYLNERNTRIAISVYGYLKRIGAIDCVRKDNSMISVEDAIESLILNVHKVHDPLSWRFDIEKRINQIRHGQW